MGLEVQGSSAPSTPISDDLSVKQNKKLLGILEQDELSLDDMDPIVMKEEAEEFAGMLNELELKRKNRSEGETTLEALIADGDEDGRLIDVLDKVEEWLYDKNGKVKPELKKYLMEKKGMSESEADDLIQELVHTVGSLRAQLLKVTSQTMINVSAAMVAQGTKGGESVSSPSNNPSIPPPSNPKAEASDGDQFNLFMLPALITIVFEMMMEVMKQKALNKDLEREMKVTGYDQIYFFAKDSANWAIQQGKAEAAKLFIQAMGSFASAGISLFMAATSVVKAKQAKMDLDKEQNNLKSNGSSDFYKNNKNGTPVDAQNRPLEFKTIDTPDGKKPAWTVKGTSPPEESAPDAGLNDGFKMDKDGKILDSDGYSVRNENGKWERDPMDPANIELDSEHVQVTGDSALTTPDGKSVQSGDPYPPDHWTKTKSVDDFLDMQPGIREMKMYEQSQGITDKAEPGSTQAVSRGKINERIEANNKQYQEYANPMGKAGQIHTRTQTSMTVIQSLQQALPGLVKGATDLATIPEEMARAGAQAAQTMAQAVKELYQQYLQAASEAFNSETQMIEAIVQFLQQFSQNTTRLVFRG